MTITEIKALATTIKNETVEDANSANRIGGAMLEIIKTLEADTAAGQALTAAQAANAATEAAPKTYTLLAMISISTLPDALGYDDGDKIYSSFYKLMYTRILNPDNGTPTWDAGVTPRLIDSFLFASKEYKFIGNNLIPTGRGIVTNVRTSGNGAAGTTDTYTITYSDGTTSTYTVTNGANGTGATVEQVRSQSPGNVPSSKLLDDELNKTDVYNVTVKVPLSAGSYYTATTARAAVPTAIKKLGLKITYATASGVWVEEQFIGSDVSGWGTTENWSNYLSDLKGITFIEFTNPGSYDTNGVIQAGYGGYNKEISITKTGLYRVGWPIQGTVRHILALNASNAILAKYPGDSVTKNNYLIDVPVGTTKLLLTSYGTPKNGHLYYLGDLAIYYAEQQGVLFSNLSINTRTITFTGFSFVYYRGKGIVNRLQITAGSYLIEIQSQNYFNKFLVVDKTIGDVAQTPIVLNYSDITLNHIIIAATGGSGVIEYVLSRDIASFNFQNQITDINSDIEYINSNIESVYGLADAASSVDGESIPDSVLWYNQEKVIGSSGQLISSSGAWWKVSDFIAIGDGVKIKTFNRKSSYNFLCYAFYSSADESSFISGYKAPDTSSFNDVLNVYEGSPIIPNGANFIRVSTNITYTVGAEYCFLKKSIVSIIEKNTPANSLIYFTVKVNIASHDTLSITADLQFPYVESEDYCALRLPDNYDPYSEPLPLIIYSHGAGSKVSDTICNISGTGGSSEYFTKKGFAILDCNALPNGLKKSWMDVNQCAGFGSEYSVNCVIAAFDYVTKNYNIAKDKVFALSTSMGGLTTGNLIANGKLPFRAVWMDCPVTGLYESAWLNPWWGNGSGLIIFMAISYLFKFDNWNESNRTFTVTSGIYAGTYSFETILYETDGRLKLNAFYEQNKSKTTGWNPWTNKRITEGATDMFIYPCPLIISHGSTDTVNDINVNKSYLNKVKAGGQTAHFREVPTSNHGLFGIGTKVLDEENISMYPIPIEIVRFFKKYY